MHNSFILQQYVCYITILDMLRALTCPSSGRQIVFSQHLVSSLSVQYSMPDESRLLSYGILYCTESDDTRRRDTTICPPEDGLVNARNMSRIVM
jgi:hypothetical protein